MVVLKRRSTSRTLALLLATACSSICNGQQIFFNADFYTVDTSNPRATAIAVSAAGVIEAVSDFPTIVAAYPSYTKVDLGGQFVLPGFQDSHIHAVEAGINRQLCVIPPNTPVEQIPAAFQDTTTCADNGQFGNNGWAIGAGIDLSVLITEVNAGSRTPLAVLDDYFGNTPVVILDAFGHGALTNTAGMTAVNYHNAMTDPPGGQLLRDGASNLIGIVTENAQQVLRDQAFPNTAANQAIAYESLLAALQVLNQNGITSVSDAGGFWRQAQTESWQTALDNGRLTVRASNALYIYPEVAIGTQINDLTARYSNTAGAQLRWNQAKIYVDGILSLSTGLISTPYQSDPFSAYRGGSGSWFGFEYFTDATTLNNVCTTLMSNGFQLHLHVTGDAGATRALDCIVAAGNTAATQPHRLTHLFTVGSTDRARFQSLNVVADYQLAPSALAQDNIDLMNERIGTTLTNEFLPALETRQAGATLVLSSDYDADVLSPLAKITTVLTRADGRSLPSLAEAIQMLTLNPARLLNHESTTGSIAVGKFADLAVINWDITSIPISTIGSATVTRTYLGGNLVYSPAPASSNAPTACPTCACFSEASTVEVYGKGKVPMKDLEVNDKVYTTSTGDKAQYETIYAFGHRQEEYPMEYLQIFTNFSATLLPLEVSPAHLLYVADKPDPVRADEIQEGDTLLYKPKGGPTQPASVLIIRTVTRNGAYMPLTKEGSLVVNGLHASSYVSISEEAPNVVSKFKRIMSEQTLLHWWLAPYRMLCLGISPDLCESDYNEEGIAHWLVWGRDIARYGDDFNEGAWQCVQILGLLLVTLFMALCMVTEKLARYLLNPFSFVILSCLLMGHAKANRRKVSKEKKVD